MSEIFLILCGGIGGALLGSFTTMLIWRLHNNETGIWTGRSKCPKCKKTLSALELIPLISWLIQRGRCKNCGKKISAFYPLIEIVFVITGMIFVQHFYTEVWWQTTLNLLLVFFALILWAYDTKFSEVDRRISWSAIILALILTFIEGEIQTALIGGLIGFSFFAVQYFYSKGRWIGAGDMELGIFMGLVLGWEKTIGALFLAYIIGSIIAIPLLLLKKKKWKSSLPMGAFLMPAFLIMLHSGDTIIEWYVNIFLF